MRNLTIGATLVAAGLAGVLAAAPAEANRPVHDHHYRDVCKNIAGKQTVLDVTGITARYKFIAATPRPNDCRERADWSGAKPI